MYTTRISESGFQHYIKCDYCCRIKTFCSILPITQFNLHNMYRAYLPIPIIPHDTNPQNHLVNSGLHYQIKKYVYIGTIR